MHFLATALVLIAPVPGPVVSGFVYGSDPFLAGQHRGVDLAASEGVEARAACTGSVVSAGMDGVTLRCGAWRVTELPLASVTVRVGARVHAGEAVGRVGALAGHRGLHLGVRRANDRFAYVDPEPLLSGQTPPVVAVPREAPRRAAPRPAVGPRRVAPRLPAPLIAPAPRAVSPPAARAPQPTTADSAVGAARGAARAAQTARLHAAPFGAVRVSGDAGPMGLAPWPAWVGVAVLLLGAVGGGVRFGVRRRLARPATQRVPSAS